MSSRRSFGWGVKLKCLGLILGHPFLEKFGYKSGRQFCGLPPLWAVNTAVAWEMGPNIPAPHCYLYQGALPSLEPGLPLGALPELGNQS